MYGLDSSVSVRTFCGLSVVGGKCCSKMYSVFHLKVNLIYPNTCHHIPVGSRQDYDRRHELNAEWFYSSVVLMFCVLFDRLNKI